MNPGGVTARQSPMGVFTAPKLFTPGMTSPVNAHPAPLCLRLLLRLRRVRFERLAILSINRSEKTQLGSRKNFQRFNMETEVFDLFGETFFCSICQEDIQESQRTLVISNCQHGFHEPCIEPWLENNNTCPNCRKRILEAPVNRPTVPTEQGIHDLDRIYIGYILTDWILFTFQRRATLFYRHYNDIRRLIREVEWQGRRSIPLEVTSLSGVVRLKTYIIHREAQMWEDLYPQQQHRRIHQCARLLEIRTQIYPQLQLFVAQRNL